MKRRIAAVVLLSLPPLAATIALAQSPAESITENEIRAHIDFLADDLLEGRDSGFRGAKLAALYIETELRGSGLAPLLDVWTMPVPIPGRVDDGRAHLTLNGETTSGRRVVQPIRSSPFGSLTAATTLDREHPEGRIVILPGSDDDGDVAPRAQEQFDAGAIAVIIVSANEELDVRNRADGRRMFPKGSRRSGGSGEEGGGGYLSSSETAAEFAEVEYAGPAIRVNRVVGAELMEAAANGALLTVEVAYDGRSETSNVMGIIRGSDRDLADEYVVVGAHYDHVGHDDLGNIWNGADDNASGTSAILEIAEALMQMKLRPKRSIVVCAWGAEERGLFGSKEFVEREILPAEKIVAYFNLDMISRNTPGHVSAIHASDSLFAIANDVGRQHGLTMDQGVSFYLTASDTAAFLNEKIPCLFFFTGLHGDYHTPTDDPPTADAHKATQIARTTCDLLIRVANEESHPTFNSPRTNPRAGTGPSRRLGIYPAARGGEGVAVESVSPRSVAANAGLQAGDLIVRINGVSIEKVADLRNALSSPEKGVEFPIDVMRGDRAITVNAVFDY